MSHWHWLALIGFLYYLRKSFWGSIGFIDSRAVAVRYYPPTGLTLLQSGLILDNFADTKDFAAAILELAQIGYIEIHQANRSENPLLKRTSKPTEELSDDQRYLLEGVLFVHQNTFILRQSSDSNEAEMIAKRMQNGFEYINENLYAWSVREGYMDENPKKTRNSFLYKNLLFLAPIIGFALYSAYLDNFLPQALVLFLTSIFGLVGVLSTLNSNAKRSEKITGFIFGLISFVALFQMDIEWSKIIFSPIGVVVVLALAVIYAYTKITRFTQKGAYAQKELQGLEMFIGRVKKDEIRRRLNLDPLYLDKLLPYAMLFGHTKHWLSYYALLGVMTPSWYDGISMDNLENFSSNVDKTSTPPALQSGGEGFSGGGGSSGGGGGGGGGDSW